MFGDLGGGVVTLGMRCVYLSCHTLVSVVLSCFAGEGRVLQELRLENAQLRAEVAQLRSQLESVSP